MFSNNKPFGTASAFGGGGSTFGASTPFGQTSNAFGAKPATSNVFGSSTFGVQPQNTGSLFGTSTQPASSGLFGQPSNTFGAPASTSTGSFGFGATSTSGGLFGSAGSTMQSSGGLFGSGSSAFGAPRPAFGGGFGTPTTGTGLFGQSTSTGTSLFGSTGFSAAPVGTTIKFNPPTGTDTMMKGGVSQNISTRHQCITCMKEYENKSLEELRVEDYAAGRKGGTATAGMGFGGTQPQTGLFGQNPAASTSAFSFGANVTQSKPLFGSTGATSAFGGGSLFGQPAQTQNTGLFGKSVGFGATTTASTPAFSFGATNTMGTGTSLFGQNTQQKSLFGQTTNTTGGLFGNTATTQTGGFGSTTGFGGFGSTNQQSGGLFGAKPLGFGTTSTTTTNTFSFGNTTNAGGGLFGQKPATSTFGTGTSFGTPSTGFGTFGTTSNTGTGLFGQNKPATSVFGQTGSSFGTGLGSSFGTSTFNSMGGLGSNTGPGLFGGNANKTTGFNFGGTGSTGFNFGGNTNPSFSFNPSSSFMGANDPNNSAALQQVQQQILAMTANPFGDSPLFRNSIKDTSRETEVLKPTNPSAQKALLNDSQYKITLLPTAKIKPKPWAPSPSGKTFLFDGLEDEEPSLNQVAFLPKKSVKKLVLKNSMGANQSTFTVTSDISNASNQNTRIDVSISMNKPDKPSSKDNSGKTPLTVNISDSNIGDGSKDRDVSITTPNQALRNLHKSLTDTSVSLSPENILNRETADTSDSWRREKLISDCNDSFAALRTKPSLRSNTYNIQSESEDDAGNAEVSGDTSLNSSGIQPGEAQVLNKSGVILTRPEYYTNPPLDELPSFVDENGDCYVDDFTVGREGYGKVTFPGQMNVAKLNLDELVHFRKKEINVYPDDDKKPPIGEGLNRKAIVTLEKVWPTDKTNHCPITDPERLSVMGYREKIERSTARLGAKFLNYIPETGSWIFQVDHFSKYGLEDSDDEMEVSKLPETGLKVPPPPPPLGLLNSQQPPLSSACDMGQRPEQLKRRPFMNGISEDGELEGFSFSSKDYFFDDGEDFANELYSPTRPIFGSHVDAERIQGMKASFFQDMDEDNWAAGEYPPLYEGVSMQKPSDLKSLSHLSSEPTKPSFTLNSFPKKQRYLDNSDRGFQPFEPYVLAVDDGMQSSMSSLSLASQARQKDWVSSLPLVKSVAEPPKVLDKQLPALNKIMLKPLSKSVLNGQEHLLADAGYFKSRSFRPGWKADGTLISLQPLTCDNFSGSLPKFILFGNNLSYSSKINQNLGFNLTFNKIGSFTGSDKEMQLHKRNLVEALELQLEYSVFTFEGDSPYFVSKPGVELIHSHAKLFEEQLKDIDPMNRNIEFSRQCANVWNLLVALWGKIKGAEDGASVYAVQMARRESFSSWLIKSIEAYLANELGHLSQDKYLTKIFLYLSCRRVSDAVKLAKEHQDFRLSLLLANAEGSSTVRKWLCSQLFNWEENGAYKFIKYDRIVVYSVLAGLLLWENVHETVNCCHGLNWKQALALHLWYHCEGNASLQVAVEEYDKAFQGLDGVQKYSSPPFPPYIKNDDFDMNETHSDEVYDTCYHLLKLFCNRAYRFDKLLMPQTYTYDNLDYRLSWMLQLALSSIGFNIPLELSCTLHMNFAAQLESLGLWHWAVFVLLHQPDSEWRTKTVKDLLLRHVSLSQEPRTEEIETFLKRHLHVPEQWIYEAKAIKAHSLGKQAEEAWFLLKAGYWNKSHSIVIKHLASDAVINEDYDYLMKYLSELAVPERSSTILDWANGGQVYIDYIKMCHMVKDVLSMETSAYELEKFVPQVASLCNRLSSIPTPTMKDRLSVAEMSKKTAAIMRSIALLQAVRTKNNSSLINLASYFKNLPMPYDYAVSETRFIAHCFLQEAPAEMEAI